MWNVIRTSRCRWLLLAGLLLGGAATAGCRGRPGLKGPPGGGGGAGGAGGAGGTGTPAALCAGPSDARLVVADQRILRLTMNETLHTVRYLVGDAEAAALVAQGIFDGGDDIVDAHRWFPPLQDNVITDVSLPKLERIAEHVGDYVTANFAPVTGCATATDACATAYL